VGLISPERYRCFLKKQTAVLNQDPISKEVAEQIAISKKYEGYIKRQLEQIERFKKLEDKKIPEDLDFGKLLGLSTEARDKLSRLRPVSIGQAARIAGVSPADISVLLIYLEAHRRNATTMVK
jgi:tRNA uridine 5-carboxymethylaminomethyl modification enzyme